jgi:CspA family cold shock protein
MSEQKEEKVYRGEVIFFSNRKGFGFVSWDEDKDLFVHFSNIDIEGFKTLRPGQTVEFTLGQNHKGQQAEHVRVIAEAPADQE